MAKLHARGATVVARADYGGSKYVLRSDGAVLRRYQGTQGYVIYRRGWDLPRFKTALAGKKEEGQR